METDDMQEGEREREKQVINYMERKVNDKLNGEKCQLTRTYIEGILLIVLKREWQKVRISQLSDILDSEHIVDSEMFRIVTHMKIYGE